MNQREREMLISNKKKIHIGIDLGPTSIGIAAIDDNGDVVDKPRIYRFSDACNEKSGSPNNQSRREKRCLRRRIQRHFNKRNDFLKLIKIFYPEIPIKCDETNKKKKYS
jgi:CRISPR/Cas system Type II protein with McrA/HNH and RuvC-like nuclease domain